MQVFKMSTIDWCNLNNGKFRLVNFQKLFINAIRSTAPALFHPCPFKGIHTLFNASAGKEHIEILPSGKFMMNLRAYEHDIQESFVVNATFKILRY